MEVQVHRSTILAAPHAHPLEEEVPLTIFDLFASNINIAVLFAFTAPTPSDTEIIEGLSKTLVHFPLLTAQLDYSRLRRRRPCLVVGGKGGGALVVEATVAADLSDLLPLEPSADFLLLHPPTEETHHLFQVQLNRFRCGGLVVAAVTHHRVADGQSMSTFFVAWGESIRGTPITSLPVYDQSWIKPRSPPKCEFQHWDLEFVRVPPYRNGSPSNHQDEDPSKITNILLRYSSEFITTKLKPRTRGKYTTFETVLAHLWRKITMARGLDDRRHTAIRVTVNGRPRMRPPVPNEFVGNLVLNAYPESNVRLLLQGGPERAAKIIHDAIRRIDESYFQSIIDFGAMHGDDDLVPVYDTGGVVLSPNLEVDSWLRFRFQEVDFGGGGKLCAFLPTWVPIEGLVIFVPGLEQDGGLNVVVTLLKEHAEKLRQISHCLM
ncbi:hypothetical protein B296_00044547 [Ensete ventricosum]|uniref:Uncharacterized protein n=1 Tax=Ensete ventricosum TaxID=4639 RepID=A0A426YGL1_ENSVE|nr:hypothetical protein B296_00044547 [Ensete ventricosum]